MSYGLSRTRAILQFFTLLFLSASVFAQSPGRLAIGGHVRPEANAANDRGRVEASLTLNDVSIFFKPSAAQEADLNTLLEQQQDPNSTNYHKWLTPEQYAARFGISDDAANRVTSWLSSQGFTNISMARGRGSVSFTGNVRAVERAFATEIHHYSVNGEMHYANASEPSVPADIGAYVLAIRGMTDFRMKPHTRVKARYTSGASGSIYVGPDDLATIYDVKPLLNSGITGAKQTIAVVGQTNIDLNDIRTFRTYFNLPPSDPIVTLVPTSRDPGVVSDDETEADLDIELAGAMARNATINFVYSTDVEVSVNYAINQNLAPVVSMSYGLCETASGSADLTSLQALARQGNAQGITWIAASGDSGAADCYQSGVRGNANGTLAVDAPASIPEVTGVGGTEFNEGSGAYWAASNDRNQSSALSYVPEVVWNDSVADGVPSSSGGGVSTFFTTKPAWQVGTGVPNDGARDVPDLSLPSSADHDPILIYSAGSFGLVGGTSCAAPAFAGMTALLNQYVVANGFQSSPGLGNMNPRLYAVASTGGVFHDITTGSNMVDGCSGVRGCSVGPVGYNAGVGYDQASGLGSVDIFNLVTAWHQTAGTVSRLQPVVTVTTSNGTVLTGDTVQVSAKVTGNGTATGTVNFVSGGVTLGSQNLTAGIASLSFPAAKLAIGFNSISAEYLGDSTFAPAAGSVTVNVNTTAAMSIQGLLNAASFRQGFSPGEIVAVFGSLLAGAAQAAAVLPLPTSLGGVTVTVNGTPCPLYFVSPSQINLQIPYSLPLGTAATLTVTYNNQSVSTDFRVSTASPGIFVDSNGAPAGFSAVGRGQTIAIYVTGVGALSPLPALGALPSGSTVSVPTQSPTITIGGEPVSTSYAFIGVPAWAIGLVQINFTIPSDAPLGAQPVVVTISGTISAGANVVVTP